MDLNTTDVYTGMSPTAKGPEIVSGPFALFIPWWATVKPWRLIVALDVAMSRIQLSPPRVRHVSHEHHALPRNLFNTEHDARATARHVPAKLDPVHPSAHSALGPVARQAIECRQHLSASQYRLAARR